MSSILVSLPKHLARTHQQWHTQILPLQQKYGVRSSWEGRANPLAASLSLTSLWGSVCVHLRVRECTVQCALQSNSPWDWKYTDDLSCSVLRFSFFWGLMLQGVVIYEFEHVIEFGGKWRDGGAGRWGVGGGGRWGGGGEGGWKPSHWWMKFKFRHLPVHTRILLLSSETITE
jgi:hypothetical protein